jgi:hypothetical protein
MDGVRQAREAALAATPLVAMTAWVAKGEAPPAEQLRRWGLAATLREETTAAAERAGKLSFARRAFIERWGLSIPCAEAVAALRTLGPLEIGAGASAWGELLRNAGHDVVALGDAAAPAPTSAPGRDVLCAWPTADDAWALGAAWRLAPGQAFALLGDGLAGSRGLRRYLATRFDKVAEVELPQFPNVHDRLVVYRKRPPQAFED